MFWTLVSTHDFTSVCLLFVIGIFGQPFKDQDPNQTNPSFMSLAMDASLALSLCMALVCICEIRDSV